MQYISISLYRKMITHALAEGLDRAVLAQLPTSIEAMDSVQAVPADQFFALHELLDQHLGPAFSVRIGQQMQIDDYGVLGLSWRTCVNAGEIFKRSERYFQLLSNTYVFKVEAAGNLSHIYLYRQAHRRGVALSNQATFSATVVVLQAMTETDIAPVQVAFQHEPPRSLDGYHEAFGCPVLFNQPHNCMTYTTAALATRTAKADASIHQFLMARVNEATNGIEVSTNRICEEVELLIQDALPSGIPSVVQVAEHMGMSNRTLTRRLAENGVTFRDLIKKTQEGVAKKLLKGTARSVAEIAFETGFSEQSAFNRAFKRWTGLSPIEYRKN